MAVVAWRGGLDHDTASFDVERTGELYVRREVDWQPAAGIEGAALEEPLLCTGGMPR